MLSFRCPKCDIAMTDEEVVTGICPICEVVVVAPKPEAAPKKPAETSGGISTAVLTWTAIWVTAFCLLPIGGLVVYLNVQDPPAEVKEATKPPVSKANPLADAKKPTDPKPKDDAKPAEPPKTTDEKKTEPEKPEPKKEDPKKIDEPKKIVEPKKVEPKKIDEPKVVEKKPEAPKVVEVKPKPIEPKRRFMNLPRLRDDAIKVDGDLADWKDVPPILLNALERGREVKKAVNIPPVQKAWVAYCSKGILVAVEVEDTSGALENEPRPAKGIWPFWDNDAIEIFVDTLNTRPRERGEPNAHQFFAFPFGVAKDKDIGGYESRILKRVWTIVDHPSVGKTPMLRAGKKTPTGWTLEILIPKEALRHGDIKPGQIFGFEIQIDTGTNVYYYWANEDPKVHVSLNPSLWGDVILGGTDAVVEVLNQDKKPLNVLEPGQPIVIRVADADRNFDPTKKERIDVMLISKSGDRKAVTLDETEPNSGVFVGSIATRLATRKREPNVFEVMPGEQIEIEYLDPIRANGERNVIQRMHLAVPGR